MNAQSAAAAFSDPSITVPSFTPLGGGLGMPDLGAPENSLFGSAGLESGSGPSGSTISAPQFADLGASL